MCGIAGFNWPDYNLINVMAETVRHRGPDADGFYIDKNVSLGHRRLSVIDISKNGHQPMQYDNLVIVYNGEIYNFKEIRDQLVAKGYDFHSTTDTEVVLYSYHQWGSACLKKFNGMWAFCIYDKTKNTLFLSRDRFGIKPLYYYFDEKKFIFASSLQAIRKHNLKLDVSIPGLNFFFYQKYIGNDLTIFENCHKVRPSENILFDIKSKTITRKSYFDIKKETSKYLNVPSTEKAEKIEKLIINAVRKRLVADVPVGSFLSGGVDSSLVSAVISRNHKNFDTFSVGFKDKSYDELQYSKLASEYIHTNHHYENMEINEDLIELVLENLDEPFGDASILPTYLLSKITRKKVTVCLSGDAGDEVFAGYDTYKAWKVARYLPRFALKFLRYLVNLLPPSDKKVTLTFKLKRFVRELDSNVNRRHLNWMAIFNDRQRNKLLNNSFISCDVITNCSTEKDLLSIQLNDITNYLAENILKKVDTASMLNSLEVRVPFLDHELVGLVLSLEQKYKIRNFKTKWLLKKIASQYLPEKIVHRPKRGFTVPIYTWIKKSGLIKGFLTDSAYYEHNLLNYHYVQQLYCEHINNKNDNARQLWLVFVFNYWWSKNGKDKEYQF